VQYTDEKTGQSYSAESIQLSTGPVHEGEHPAQGQRLPQRQPAEHQGAHRAAGELRFDRKLKRYNLRRHAPVRRNLGRAAGGKTMTFAAQGQVLVDLAANVASWTGLKVSANQLRALGELNVRDLDKTPQVSGGLSIAQFNLRTFLDSIGHPLPATADAAA
jgi:AsmA protein